MKRIYYHLTATVNNGTAEEPLWEDVQGAKASLPYSEANLELAEKEAYNGEYTIEDDGIPEPKVTAPRNVLAGEYITVNGVLYLATENIPNGEPIIVGQNAIETTIEEQLAELAKGE